ncbi:uncharacterized protein [Nicotiana tomentosiformis]|uniref:uncharacterized protein n=1 Tax=Nicotiana tomentosiformis TaxID=4098 RepID=UPI00388CD41E
MIGKLREEVDVIRTESLRWKEGMDRFVAEKETARAQLSSSETQLQKMKEKGLVQSRKIEALEARLASVLAKAESDAEKAKADADALVAIYQADAEAAQLQAREAADAEALVSDGDDDDDGSKSGYENGGKPDKEETAHGREV